MQQDQSSWKNLRQYLQKQQFLSPIQASKAEMAACGLQKWVTLWTQVLTDLTSDSITSGRVIVDVLNEPDSYNIK